jgi:hypothetical protein
LISGVKSEFILSSLFYSCFFKDRFAATYGTQ